MTDNITIGRRLRQQRWRERCRDDRAVLQVEVDLLRTTEWLVAAGLLDPALEVQLDPADYRKAVASALWRAAELSISAWEQNL